MVHDDNLQFLKMHILELIELLSSFKIKINDIL